MEENVKSIILIGNSTFTFTEDGNAEQQPSCSKYPGEDKQNFMPFNTITITSLGDSTRNDCQQMEPCVFDNNFEQFGYFTQDCSNLTVYLNESSLLRSAAEKKPQWNNNFNLAGELVPDDSYPFFNAAGDCPFDDNKLNEGLHLINILSNKIENDAPEYIDINSLVLNNEIDKSACCTAVREEDDDDVIFVKEYKIDDDNNNEKKPAIKEAPKKVLPTPRRNPKRQVQLQKVSVDLANKLTMDDYFEDTKYVAKEHYMANTRRSTRTTGAVFSPPSSLNGTDFKVWPVDGMHEKPTFNTATKKIEKVPNAPKKIKYARTVTHYNRRKAPNTKKAKNIKVDVSDNNKDFAILTHKTFHSALSFVEQVKEYNKLRNVTSDDTVPENLKQAEDILIDVSILYGLANNVPEEYISKYLNSLTAKEKLGEFLNSLTEDCDEEIIKEK